MSELKWLLVGAGDIAAKRVAPALNETKNSTITAVCDIAKDRAESLATSLGATAVFTDLDAALKTTDANAVYLATPVGLHASGAAAVLNSGRHVLVEKPLGISAADAKQAVDAAAANPKLKAGCAYFRRCSDRYAQAQQMLSAGEFGKIVLTRMTYFSWFNPAKDDPKYWRVVPSAGGGGPLADMGSHMFDVFIGLLGMPKRIYARTKTLVQPYEVEDSSVILMEMPDGSDVTASFHWNSKTWAHEFEIIGTEGKLKWFPYDAGPVVKTIGRAIDELDLPGAANVHAPLIADFVQAVIENRAPAVPLAEALKTNILLDAVYESARTGKEVTL